ncbi:MAG: hypothetical protein FJ216_05205 [Ignavibacteria bacterium]|nr:hypothetical protein [Ignavibacteria bacterium]
MCLEVNPEDIKDSDEKTIIIATEPLTENEEWEKIEGLKAFENGEFVKT